jgi:antitoxin (DNA-binding transcriptional repressor) of toxin-antitoxin stability system
MQIVSSGEEILVADERGPIARILPFAPETDRATSSDELDAPKEEVEQAFYGD